MAAVAQRSMPLQTGAAQICARPDPFQQALIVCPPGFQGKDEQAAPGAPTPWRTALASLTLGPPCCGRPRDDGARSPLRLQQFAPGTLGSSVTCPLCGLSVEKCQSLTASIARSHEERQAVGRVPPRPPPVIPQPCTPTLSPGSLQEARVDHVLG